MKEKKAKYQLNPQGEFIVENYNFAKPFANFFPGIAGKYGIPMWVFYVNRGQGISSFGTKDKDHAILEFFPANRAWQMVSLQGFRTFLKIGSAKKTLFYEPFQNGNLDFNLYNRMSLTAYDLKIEEINLSLGLKINIEYFTIPADSYAGLSRIVTIKNLGRLPKTIQLLDGLPSIVPFGTSNLFLKKLSRTIEAWMNVERLNKGVPFYKLDVDPADRPEVIHIKEGNFYLGFHYKNKKAQIIKPIVDPQAVFGPITDFSTPLRFLAAEDFQYPKKEILKNKTPCGFLLLKFKLDPQQEKTFYTVIGNMRNREILNSSLSKITAAGYLLEKKEKNRKIIQELQSDIACESNSRALDLYAQQTYLDNIIRGGYPEIFKEDSVFYLYSRKHGDLERDYNKFQIQPTYFSQGNGNYRDMNQNRRTNVWFHPAIKDEDLATFFNLLQTDGFNPLVVKGTTFSLESPQELKTTLTNFIKENDIPRFLSFLKKPFTPGEIVFFIEENNIGLKASLDELLNLLLSSSRKNHEAEHGEGFWTDHWTYNLDLLESYLGVYPEKLKEIVFEKKVFTFYDNSEVVKPRQEKYILHHRLVRQLHSVAPDNAKKEMIRKRADQPHLVRTEYGKGQIYQTTLVTKLLSLLVNKLASLDPFGVGIEMEANKPNWFDALNGLPALFGSSLCETFELKRLTLLLKDILEKTGVAKIQMSEEIYRFLIDLDLLVREYNETNSPDKDYQYWNKTNSLKEDYRNKTKMGLSGKELEMPNSNLSAILNNALKKLDAGINKARNDKNGLYPAYFINEVKEYVSLNALFVKPTRFIQKKLPLFLGAQMHGLRLTDNINEAKNIYRATKDSPLYDKKLKMYKVTASLKDMPEEIGRCRIFSPGWLEHESIWLHMEYKYLLEILRAGLYEEFYEDFKNVLVPFQKPQCYGRSILENSSFIVSSAFADKNLHGNGFVARLSGSTAEYLQIWLLMNLGPKPFSLDGKGKLSLKFSPLLASWLFKPAKKLHPAKGGIQDLPDEVSVVGKVFYTFPYHKKDYTYSFNFLSKTQVVYHNPKRKNTFGKNNAIIKKITFKDKNDSAVEIPQDTISSPYAEEIRSGLVKRIDIYLD